MSQNYNRQSSNYGYGPNLGPSSNNFNTPSTNPYSMYGYGTNPNQINPNQNINIQARQIPINQGQQSSWGNPQFKP